MSDIVTVVEQTANVVSVISTNHIAVSAPGLQGAAGIGVPTGGTVGQVLAKINSTNYNTQWVDQTGGGDDVQSVNGQTGVVVLTQDHVAAGSTNGVYTLIEKSKLAGIATTATANQTDAYLLARSNHTGTQSVTTITGLAAVAISGDKSDIGLGNVDNTSDANKPVSTATQTALNLKANLESPTFTGTVGGITTAMVSENTNLYFTNERAQDAVGAMVDSTLVYDDAGNALGRAAITGAVTIAAGSNTSALAAIGASSIYGNPTTSSAAPQAVTPAQARSMLAVKPALQMVATRCGWAGGPTSQYLPANRGMAGRTRHCLPYGAISLQPIWSSTYTPTAGSETVMPGGFGFIAVDPVTVVAGGTGYAVGDMINVTVATNQYAPRLMVMEVSSGVVTRLSVVHPGGFADQPATGLATTKVAGGGSNTLTVTLTVAPVSYVMNAGLEQVWGNQNAVSGTNVNGVMRYTRGATQRLTNGDIAVPFGQHIRFDPLSVNLAAGALIGTRWYSPGTGAFASRRYSGSGGLGEISSFSVNASACPVYGGAFPTSSAATVGITPVAIMGVPLTPGPSWIIVGDSLAKGQVTGGGALDSGDSNANCGFVERAINQLAPFSNFSTSGDSLNNWSSQTGAAMRMQLMQELNASHVFEHLGGNDVRNALFANLAAFETAKIKFWQILLGLNIKEIWACTLMPQTTSTDGWTTTVNQTPTAANTIIQQYNTKLRNGDYNAYIGRVLDLGTSVESTVGSGIWPANSTSDGVHPGQSQVATIAASIASAFPLATL